jgi:ubiquinone/menaquinone biosynthesis C-methylase UbiE
LALLVLLLAAAGLGAADRLVSRCQNGLASESEVERLASVVGLRPGMHVAEVGAGDGRMAVGTARRVTASGRVYATELEASQIEAMRAAAKAAGLENMHVVQSEERSVQLPEGCCDVIYMRRVYHHLSDPPAMHKSLHFALRPGGRLVVIDFQSPAWRFYRKHGIERRAVIAQLREAGFHLENEIGDWSLLDYCLVFRKPA